MNKTFSLEQISRTGEVDANSILRQHKLGLMARFLEMKTVNPKMKQKEIAKDLGYSSSTLQRYRYDKKCKILIKQRIPKELQDIK